MDGYEVARQLRRQPGMEQAVLVAVTGYGQDDDRRRSYEAGIDRHLLKPIDPVELQSWLGQLPVPVHPERSATPRPGRRERPFAPD